MIIYYLINFSGTKYKFTLFSTKPRYYNKFKQILGSKKFYNKVTQLLNEFI